MPTIGGSIIVVQHCQQLQGECLITTDNAQRTHCEDISQRHTSTLNSARWLKYRVALLLFFRLPMLRAPLLKNKTFKAGVKVVGPNQCSTNDDSS